MLFSASINISVLSVLTVPYLGIKGLIFRFLGILFSTRLSGTVVAVLFDGEYLDERREKNLNLENF